MESLIDLRNEFMELPLLVDSLDNSVFSAISNKKFSPESFYLSGLEVISFLRERKFVLETVLVSTISFDNELLVVKSGSESDQVIDICGKHGLSYSEITLDNDNLNDILTKNSSITHVYCAWGDNVHLSIEAFNEIAATCSSNCVELIMSCTGENSLPLGQLSGIGADFVVSSLGLDNSKSMVLAKRCRLVQTEGVARSFLFDLHAYWQQSLKKRNAIIEPMAV